MNYSYEEIRQVVFDILSGRETGSHISSVSQTVGLENAVAKTFVVRDGAGPNDLNVHHARLSPQSADYCQEVIWDLILQRIIIPGSDSSNPNLPHFKVTSRGRTFLDDNEEYFFHDTASYETLIRKSVPDIDELTMLYLKEAVQAYRTGCLLSASVMLGVASENEFLRLLDVLKASSKWERDFSKVFKERNILGKINKFRTAIEPLRDKLGSEDLDTTLMGVQSIIRNNRNDSGHPTGLIMSREQCFVSLQVFIPFVKKLHQLAKFFEA